MRIDLADKIPGSSNFIWAEALWLPQWRIHVFPTEEQLDGIIKIAPKIQFVRDFYRKSVRIHSWVRPDLYNQKIGGSNGSWHKKGGAIDFSIDSDEISVNDIRKMLEPKLEELQIRMELNTPTWVHIDIKPCKPHESRAFHP